MKQHMAHSLEKLTDNKPVIEVAFNSYLPSPLVLDSFVEIIRKRKISFESKQKQIDSHLSEGDVAYSDSELDEIDEKIEKILKQIDCEQKQAREALYI